MVLLLGCSRSGVALLRRDWLGQLVGAPIERSWDGDNATLVALLRAVFGAAALRKVRLQVTLADDLCRLHVTAPAIDSGWVLHSDPVLCGPFAAIALPQALQQAVLQVADEFGLRKTRIAPHCCVVWRHWKHEVKPADWFGVAHDNSLTLLAFADGQLRALVREPLDQAAMKDPLWLSRCTASTMRALQVAAPARILLSGEVPQPWTRQLPGRIACTALVAKDQQACSRAAALAMGA
jgi:hypothetical protein